MGTEKRMVAAREWGWREWGVGVRGHRVSVSAWEGGRIGRWVVVKAAQQGGRPEHYRTLHLTTVKRQQLCYMLFTII